MFCCHLFLKAKVGLQVWPTVLYHLWNHFWQYCPSCGSILVIQRTVWIHQESLTGLQLHLHIDDFQMHILGPDFSPEPTALLYLVAPLAPRAQQCKLNPLLILLLSWIWCSFWFSEWNLQLPKMETWESTSTPSTFSPPTNWVSKFCFFAISHIHPFLYQLLSLEFRLIISHLDFCKKPITGF